jgi:hypothetical protein
LIDYFVVINNKKKGRVLEQASDFALLIQPKKELFEKLEKDYKNIKYDLKKQVIIIQDIGDSRSEKVL